MKHQLFQALRENRGRLTELELGLSLGLDEDQTQKIISQLLDEHRIEFVQDGHCNYKPIKIKRMD